MEYNYHGVKYITSEEGFKWFDDNFIKEIKNNFKIRETLNIDNMLYEILTLETDTEDAVGKYQNSMTAARHKSVPWWMKELTIMRKKINAMR